MTNAMHVSLTAIGRQLAAAYSPVGTTPSELEALLAELVEREAGARESRPATETLRSSVAQPRLRP
jgi:hypothetical protein